MLPYYLKCKEKTNSKNPKVVKTDTGRIMVILNCAVAALTNWELSKNKKQKGCCVVRLVKHQYLVHY